MDLVMISQAISLAMIVVSVVVVFLVYQGYIDVNLNGIAIALMFVSCCIQASVSKYDVSKVLIGLSVGFSVLLFIAAVMLANSPMGSLSSVAVALFAAGTAGIGCYQIIRSSKEAPESGKLLSGTRSVSGSSTKSYHGRGSVDGGRHVALPRMRQLSSDIFSQYGVGTGKFGTSCIGLPPNMYSQVFY